MSVDTGLQAQFIPLSQTSSSRNLMSGNLRPLKRVKTVTTFEPHSQLDDKDTTKSARKLIQGSSAEHSGTHTFYKTKSLKPNNSHLIISHQNSNSTIHFRTQLQSKNELPILKPISKPSFLANYQISYDERVKLRNINKKIISNDDQKKGYRAQKIEDIKLYVQREIDKKNPSKHHLVSQLLNQKPALRQPELRNLKINKSGTKTKNVGNGSTTILINKVENKNNYLEKITSMQPDSSYLLRLALKWKNMRWLLEHKKDQVQKIILSYKEMNWFLNSRGIRLKKDIFLELMGLLRLKDDKEFCDNIFYMFDEDRDNIIDYKELVLGLKFSSSDSYASKITCIKRLT